MTQESDVEAGERCQRCGQVGSDRRTLWHACWYDMGELGLPWEEVSVWGVECDRVGAQPLGNSGLVTPIWGEPAGRPGHHPFFTLQVCKDCRADWMAAIAAWFRAPPPPPQGCGSGIFVHELGTSREITREEWDRRQAEKGGKG